MNTQLEKLFNEQQTVDEYWALLTKIQEDTEADPFRWVVDLEEALHKAASWAEGAEYALEDACTDISHAESHIDDGKATKQDVIEAKAAAWDAHCKHQSCAHLESKLREQYDNACNILSNWGRAEFREDFAKRKTEREFPF